MSTPLPKLPIPEETPQHKRIAWWFENTVVRSIKRLVNDVSELIRNIFSFSLRDWAEDFEQGLIEIIRPYINYLQGIPNLPPFMLEVINRAASGQHQAGLAVLALLIPVLYGALSNGISEPLGMIVRAVVNRQLRPTLIDPFQAIELLNKKLISENECRSVLIYHGYDDKSINMMITAKRPLTDDELLSVGLWRGLVSDSYVFSELDNRGWDSTQKQLWMESRDLIPSPQDLVSMATREAFNDAAAKRFGYDADFPEDAAEWAEKGGLKREWFVRYWRAHWRLPGLVQVREMFHRQIITEEDVNSYLLAADIPVFWRQAIVKWMYREVTRVDLRRLYDRGIIGLDEVYTRYLKMGYSPDDAESMSIWTGIQYADETRELTKSDILGMYREGILSSNEVMQLMTALGYSESNTTLLMAREDLKQHEQYEKKIIENVHKLYIGEIIDRTDVFAELGKIATPGHFIEQSLAVWDLEKKAKVRRPSITQLRDMVLSETITLDMFKHELSAMRYSDMYIEWYIEHWALRGE